MELSDVNDIRRELECMSPLSDKTINITLTFRDLNDIVDALNLFYEKGWNDLSDIEFSSFDRVETTKYSDGTSKETGRRTYYKAKGVIGTYLSNQEIKTFEYWKENYYTAIYAVESARAELQEASKYEVYQHSKKTPSASIVLLIVGLISIIIPVVVIAMYKDPFLTFLAYSEEGSTMTYEELIALYDIPAFLYDNVFPFCLLGLVMGPVALFISLMVKLRRVKNIKHSINNRQELEAGIARAREILAQASENLKYYQAQMPEWYSDEPFTKSGSSIYFFDKLVVRF